MAKMFYNLGEAAEKLGVSEDAIKALAAGGKLQVFRDRDKIMFKCEQVDALSTSRAALELSGTSIPLQDSGDTDALGTAPGRTGTSLSGDTAQDSGARGGSRVSVFDADEVETADPLAQTQVSQPESDDSSLVLESVGAGSGLLDLTKESDDTSLGAELLDEIYPGDSAAGTKAGALPGASGSFHPGDAEAGVVSGEEPAAAGLEAGAAVGAVSAGYADEDYDPAGAGLSIGVLLVAMVSMIVALIIAIHAVAGVGNRLTTLVARDTNTVYMYGGGLIGAVLVFGVAGYFLGKTRE
jgi:hypothetical protein